MLATPVLVGPPLVMGAAYQPATNSYWLGLWMLVIVGTFALIVAGMLGDTSQRKDQGAKL